MAENLLEFRLEIDRTWSAREFYRELEALSFFHNAFYLSSLLYEPGPFEPDIRRLGAAPAISDPRFVHLNKDTFVREFHSYFQHLDTSHTLVRIIASTELQVRRIQY